MGRVLFIEQLEERSLLSVSASVLAGPLTKGHTSHYALVVNGVTSSVQTITVLGPATFNGRSATELESTSTTNGQTSVSDSFEVLDPTVGLEILGHIAKSTSGANTITSTQTYSPMEVVVPPTLTAGVIYTSKWTATTATVINPGNTKSTSTLSATQTVELLSNSTQSITVPAGTFSCYELKITQTDQTTGHPPTTSTADTFIAAGVGAVKSVQGAVIFEMVPASTGPTGKLAIASQPTAGIAGAVLAPTLKVDVESSTGAINTTNTSNVTLSIASGPTGATLGGTITVAAVKGIATFSNLKFTVAGAYTLKASDGALTVAVSKTITIVPAAAAVLVFTQQPTTAHSGVALSPTLTVAVEDAFSNVVTTNSSNVALTITAGPTGGALVGTASAQAVKGIATFKNLSLKKAGTYKLKATDGTLTAAVSKSIVVS